MVYSTEKMLKEHRDKISDADAKSIESAIEEAKQAIQGNDTSKITAAVDRLTQASHKLAEAMYRGAGARGAGATPPGASSGPAGPTDGGASGRGKGESEVIDAEG